MCPCVRVFVCTCMYVHVRVCMHLHVRACRCVRACAHVCECALGHADSLSETRLHDSVSPLVRFPSPSFSSSGGKYRGLWRKVIMPNGGSANSAVSELGCGPSKGQPWPETWLQPQDVFLASGRERNGVVGASAATAFFKKSFRN